MRLRRLSLTAVAAVAALALASCGEQQPIEGGAGGEGAPTFTPEVAQDVQFEPGTTMARLAESGSITIGTKFDQPLFGLRTLDGQLVGFDTEIARIIAGGLGIPPENINWVEAPSAQRESLLERGEVDMVAATYTINDERAQRVDFAGPYYVAGQTLMVRADNQDVTGPDSLRGSGARVCTVTGSTPSENIRPYIDESQLVLFDTYSQCRDSLGNNQVDVVTTDNVILLGYVAESDGAFKLAGEPFTDEPYGIGIGNGDVAFCEFINQQLQQAGESGAYAAAWEATAGTVDEETPDLPELAPCGT